MSTKKSHTYRFDVAYEGTNYAGWQVQPQAVSIQEIIEKKLAILLKAHHRITASGRTDAGVHALQQVCHVRCETPLDEQKILRSLNGLLPHDIRITSFYEVFSLFHARKSAQAKEYHYTLVEGPFILPFQRHSAWHIPKQLDATLLEQAAARFRGTHDFFAYANENSKGAAARNSIRTIYELRLHEELVIAAPSLRLFRLEFYGNGFLYKMVRNIVGMMVAVALKKRPIEDIEKAFSWRDRKAVDRAAPPHGLCLVRVEYPSIS